MIDRFRRWFNYEQDAHKKTLAALESVPVERRDSAEFRRAVSIMGHIVAARRVWLSRLGVIPPAQGELFPENSELPQVAAECETVQRLWSEYLHTLDDGQIARVFNYKSYDGGHFRNHVEDILAQLFGHSWYHRGQIAMLVRAAGGQPAATDLVYWCREAVADRDN
jgi:uncharacterized damage-inducible protein DinB